jgi:PAS domain S-box-containing protein
VLEFVELDPAAETLSQSEARFRTLVETISAAVFLYRDNKTIYVNHAAERISGYTRKELLELGNFWQLVHPDSLPRLMEMYEAHMRGDEIPKEYEIKILTKCGESRWVQFTFDWVTSGPERGDLLGTAVDITERKEAEGALRESEVRYRALYRDNPSMYFTVAADGTVLSVNEYGASQLGFSVSELEGKSVLSVFNSEDKRAVEQHLADCVANLGVTAVWQVRKVRKDGVIIWVEERARATRDVSGNPTVLIVCEDITERHEMEDNLRESEARLLAFAHAVPDVAFILDEDGVYVEILGRLESDPLHSRSADLKGKRLRDVLPRTSADAFLAAIRKTIRTQEPQVLEYELDVPAAGRWFEGRTAPLSLVGERSMVVWLALDITARKNAELALVELREELDRKAEGAASRGKDHGLTFRELTVLQLVVAGQSDKEIGVTLGISPLTANKHVGNILRKLRVGSRTSACAIAIRDGLVS